MERITDYFLLFLETIKNCTWVLNKEVSFREIDEKEGYIRGTLYLYNSYELHIAEYIVISHGKPIAEKYRYQLQTPDGISTIRWDNAPHHRTLSSFPHHKHCCDDTIVSSSINNIFEILNSLDDELKDLI